MNLKDVQADLLRRGAWLTVQWQNSGWSVALVAVSNGRHCGFGDASELEDAFKKARADFDNSIRKDFQKEAPR